MFAPTPAHDPAFQSIVQRMARAEWVTTSSIANRNELIVALTPNGKKLIERCVLNIQVKLPSLSPSETKREEPTVLDYEHSISLLKMVMDLASMIQELCPPPFSRAEEDVFLKLLLEKAKR